MEYLFIYCLQIFDTLSELGILAMIFGIIGSILGIVAYLLLENDKQYASEYQEKSINRIQSACKNIPITCLIIGTLLMFIPTKQTLLIMGGTWLGKKAVTTVVNDEKIQKIDTIINLELDKVIKDLKGNVQNASNNGQ